MTTTTSTRPDTRRPQTVALLPLPPSVPAAQPWPAAGRSPDIGINQPPLPWSPDPAEIDDPAGIAEPVRRDSTPMAGTTAVRTVEFGGGWADPAPGGLPAPRPTAMRWAYLLLETLQGRRPVAQLSGQLSPAASATLTRLVRRRTDQRRLRLRAVHLHRPSLGTVEAVALYQDGDRRVSPVAYRLDAGHDRWTCTALDADPGPER